MNLLWKSIIMSKSLVRILIWERVAFWHMFNFRFNTFFFHFLNFIWFFFILFVLLFSKPKEFSKETLFLLRFFLFNFLFSFIFTVRYHVMILIYSNFFFCLNFVCDFTWICAHIKTLFFRKVLYLLNLVLPAQPFIKIVDIWEKTHSLIILFFTLNINSHFSIPIFSICLCKSYISTFCNVSTLLNCIFAQYFKVSFFF